MTSVIFRRVHDGPGWGWRQAAGRYWFEKRTYLDFDQKNTKTGLDFSLIMTRTGLDFSQIPRMIQRDYLMKRQLETQLRHWAKTMPRLPLIIRGARQVGKTFLIESVGRELFNQVITVNFELTPTIKSCFESLDPAHIIPKLEVHLNQRITPENSLLFLDEIQECPQALMALRYFKEKMPELAVISAGSLLEFALEQEAFRMPVGRVKQLHLHPLSFMEFLAATQKTQRQAYLKKLTLSSPHDLTIHQILLEEVRHYLYIGGMPAVVQEYCNSHSLKQAESMQNAIIASYQEDFGKYAAKARVATLQFLYKKLPRFVGQQVKYAYIDPERKSRDLKNDLALLLKAKIISPIFQSPASGVPLGAMVNDAIFKLLWMDVGLLQNMCGLQLELMSPEQKPLQINQGSITEQFVGQELLAYKNPEKDPELYFWKRAQKNSQAEVDYIIAIGNKIYPIEVKSGTTGSLKSLQLFLKEKPGALGIRISEHPLSFDNNILSIPLYLCSQIERLVAEAEQLIVRHQ